MTWRSSAVLFSIWALGLPAIASGDATVTLMPSTYVPLPPIGVEGVQAVDFLPSNRHNYGAYGVPLPFPVSFNDGTYTSINIGIKGYVTFGDPELSTSSVSSSDPHNLITTGGPQNLIAVWWSFAFYDETRRNAGDLTVQVRGTEPNRSFVIQWHAKGYRSASAAYLNSWFQAQLWFFEGLNAFEARYGSFSVDPNDYTWPYTAGWGLKLGAGPGTLGPLKPGALPCIAGGDEWAEPDPDYICTVEEHFPTSSTIRYQFGPAFPSGTVLVLDSYDSTFGIDGTSAAIAIAAAISNHGTTAAAIPADLFLARSDEDEGEGSFPLEQLTLQVPGAETEVGSATVDRRYLVEPPPGMYRACMVLDPEALVLSAPLRSCSTQILRWGADLTAEIASMPTEGIAGAALAPELAVTLRNDGAKDAGSFRYRIAIEPAEDPSSGYAEDLYSERIDAGLAAGQRIELRFDGVALPRLDFPAVMKGERYRVVVYLDVEDEIEDVDPANDRIASAQTFESLRPQLAIRRAELHIAGGECIFGEPLEAVIEVCNSGKAAAIDFHPGLSLGFGEEVSVADDVVVTTSPQSCGVPGSPNFVACEPFGSRIPACVDRRCRLSCDADADCPSGELCIDDPALAASLGETSARSCTNHVLPPRMVGGGTPCQEYVVRGRIPIADNGGERLAEGIRRFHFIDDPYGVLSEPLPAVSSTEPMACRDALPDLTASDLDVPETMLAGEPYPIQRVIRNLGQTEQTWGAPPKDAASYRYGYYLAPVATEVSAAQILLPIRATGGLGAVTVGTRAEQHGSDVVVVPEQLQPGTYLLGIVIDPWNERREISKANNIVVHQRPVRIEASTLSIASLQLPPASAGKRYTFQFSGLGGESYSWSAAALPRGLSLLPNGVLAGKPMDAGDHLFLVRMVSGDRALERRVALRVYPISGALEVSTSALPAAVRHQVYGHWVDELGNEREGLPLAANGGRPPYAWEVVGSPPASRLPQGLVLSAPEGVIVGSATTLATASRFTVRVTDANGAQATRELEILVSDHPEPALLSATFADGAKGQSYDSCVEAAGADTDAGYLWSIDRQTIPPGLEAETFGRLACLRGAPEACGSYRVAVSVTNELGAGSSRSLPLEIECGSIQLIEQRLPLLRPGQEVSIELLSNGGAAATYALYQGRLPWGLELRESGVIEGRVDVGAAVGSYDFIVEVRDPDGRSGIGSLVLRVTPEPRSVQAPAPAEKSGCSSSGGGVEAWLVIAAGAMLASRGGRRAVKGYGGRRSSILAAALLLGAAACSDGEEEPAAVAGLCDEVDCREGTSCDPTDGSCKCGGLGGVSCLDGERCVLAPNPHCASPRCEGVECSDGLRCDPLTGDCVCGGVACAAGESCVAGRCEAPGPCLGVRCAEGMSCDPEDGSCKCGDAVCASDESCIEGSCSADRCKGVACPFDQACNREDGSCHCAGESGPICLLGEACVRSGAEQLGAPPEAACVSTDRCHGVVCPAGASCDPLDGSCRCGGLGASMPICDPEQSCIDGSCQGGILCEPGGMPKVCGIELSCDPKDGVCKCGGVGGEPCGEDEVCTLSGGAHRCLAACTIGFGADEGCGEGEGCYLDRALAHGRAFCASGGPKGVDQSCDAFNDCAPGLFCSSGKICRQLCRPSEKGRDCGAGTGCLQFPDGDSTQADLGYCVDVG